MFLRASTLSIGATESSRSRNTWSASSPFAFSRNRGFDPGVARQERLLRKALPVLVSSAIAASLGSVTHRSPAAYGESAAARGDLPHPPPVLCPVSPTSARCDRLRPVTGDEAVAEIAGVMKKA